MERANSQSGLQVTTSENPTKEPGMDAAACAGTLAESESTDPIPKENPLSLYELSRCWQSLGPSITGSALWMEQHPSTRPVTRPVTSQSRNPTTNVSPSAKESPPLPAPCEIAFSHNNKRNHTLLPSTCLLPQLPFQAAFNPSFASNLNILLSSSLRFLSIYQRPELQKIAIFRSFS